MNIYKMEKINDIEITTSIEIDSANKSDIEFAWRLLGEEEQLVPSCNCISCKCLKDKTIKVFIKGEN